MALTHLARGRGSTVSSCNPLALCLQRLPYFLQLCLQLMLLPDTLKQGSIHCPRGFQHLCPVPDLQVRIKRRQDELQTELEEVGEDMEKMALLLDEMEQLNNSATELDMTLLDRNIDKMMPELGFSPEDSDQLVAAYRYHSGRYCHSLTHTVQHS